MDEQCIADVAGSIIGGSIIERSKDALDGLYFQGSPPSQQLLSALDVYGAEAFADEFKFCVDEIIKVVSTGKPEKLRELLFKKKTTNAFPSIFAILIIAFHELIVKDKKKIADYDGVKKAITNISERIDSGRKGDERRQNVNTVKGLIAPHFVDAGKSVVVYGSHTTSDIEAVIRRSEIELSDYELKQGLLTLSDRDRKIDSAIIDKVVKTICAIANNGPSRIGKLIIGVTDKVADADRVEQLDKIEPKKLGKRHVVGVNREAAFLGETVDAYFARWKNGIANSALSPALRDAVLSHIDYHSFYGLGIIVITIPAQTEVSFVDDKVYWRNGSSTELAESGKQIANITKRF